MNTNDFKSSRIGRFYRVLVVSAVSLTGCDADEDTTSGESTVKAADAGPDATPGAIDASSEACCAAICGQEPCVCQGEEIPCCWLVPHPLCENLCDE